MTRLGVCLVFAIALATPVGVAGQGRGPLAESQIALGRPTTIRVTRQGEEAVVEADIGERRARESLPLTGATSATIERVALAGGAAAAVVKARGADDDEAAAIVIARRGIPVVAWTGRLDPHGDPGERRADVIEVEDRTGDGAPDLIVGETRQNIRICGQSRTLLAPRAVDPRRLELRPVELRRVPAGDVVELEAVKLDEPETPPLLEALQFESASSTFGVDDLALATPPGALADGSVETAWAEGRPGPGRWEFVTARWTGEGHEIASVTLVLAPAQVRGVAVTRPRTLYLVGDRGPSLHVTLPATAGAGDRVRITPPEPLAWRCLSIVLDEAVGNAAHVGLAEVIAHSDVDGPDAVASLVETLVADADGGDRAARLLARLGPSAQSAVREVWPTLTPLGKRRAVRVFAGAVDRPEGQRALLAAARDEEEEVRQAAVEELVRAGDAAGPALEELAGDASAGGDEAAHALVRLDPVAATGKLLMLAARPGGSDRPRLRTALRAALRLGGDEAQEAFNRWAEAHPPVAAAASMLLAASAGEPVPTGVAPLLRWATGEASRFEDRWRLVGAAGRSGPDPVIDSWLTQLAREAPEWMLRGAAVEALRARGTGTEVLRRAIEDDYPRVRVAAIQALAEDRAAVPAIVARVRRDSWSMVRAAGVRALGGHPEGRPEARRALADDAQTVRAAAVETLTRLGDRDAAPLVAARLEDDDEWPIVLEAAIDYAASLCATSLVEPLGEVVRRGLVPDAWAPDIDLAARALDTLGMLGGPDAAILLRRAASESAPAPLRAAANRARAQPARCR